MLSRQFGLAIAAVVLVAGSLTGVQNSLCRAISTDSRALYLFAEYKMLTGDKESAVRLLQEASVQKQKRPAANVVTRGGCTEMTPGVAVVMY